jgi:hypothetical protein
VLKTPKEKLISTVLYPDSTEMSKDFKEKQTNLKKNSLKKQ